MNPPMKKPRTAGTVAASNKTLEQPKNSARALTAPGVESASSGKIASPFPDASTLLAGCAGHTYNAFGKLVILHFNGSKSNPGYVDYVFVYLDGKESYGDHSRRPIKPQFARDFDEGWLREHRADITTLKWKIPPHGATPSRGAP